MKKLLSIIAITMLLTGCAIQRSFPVEYKQGENPHPPIQKNYLVGVTKWKDKRAVAQSNDNLGEKAVQRIGPATIGITSKGKDFVRVADFVRDAFIQELRAAGVNTKEINIIPTVNDINTLSKIAQNNNTDLTITADLLSFDINCNGAWTLDCSRKVAIMLNAVGKNGQPIITREIFDATYVNNEGAAVLHKTLLDQLTNQALQPVLEKSVDHTIEAINQQKI
ncbi:hypothetical protein LH433_08105 [Laribacter hongkongensis]|uniref:hypothetical protein n=1 Tax=Laribacter hongkongensis TaxID=168471 RepID=UPI001EFC9B44|nr:hypothetical protein [Laribacter hongkongensis]MCG9106707.1 hypothetical protein [Laribacter hongkongensis]